jgi:hypothetical protein
MLRSHIRPQALEAINLAVQFNVVAKVERQTNTNAMLGSRVAPQSVLTARCLKQFNEIVFG